MQKASHVLPPLQRERKSIKICGKLKWFYKAFLLFFALQFVGSVKMCVREDEDYRVLSKAKATDEQLIIS
jgi:hypothetical protein